MSLKKLLNLICAQILKNGEQLKLLLTFEVKLRSPDSIPSPSLKIQIMGGKGVKAKHCWALSPNFLYPNVC